MEENLTESGRQRYQEFLQLAEVLNPIYWQIRYFTRNPSRVRRHYRQAEKEKARLAGLGIDREAMRLYCLHLKNPQSEKRKKRFFAHFDEPLQLELF